MLSVQCWKHMAVFHNLYPGLIINAPLRILLTVYGVGDGIGEGGMKLAYQVFQKNAYPRFWKSLKVVEGSFS